MLDLHQKSDVRVKTTLLQQVVVDLLQISESLVVLDKSVKLTSLLAGLLRAGCLGLVVRQDLRGCIEFDTSTGTLLVSLENHV